MNNNLGLSDEKVNALLQMAAQKLGQDPAQLKATLESGNLDGITNKMDAGTQSKVNAMLQNPKALETLLQNDKIRSMLGNMNQK